MKALNWITNRHVVSALIAAPLLFSCAYASAEEMAAEAAAPAVAAAPAEPAPPYTLTFNLGLYSNYMFRGVALSDGPALQGGIDFAHSSGLYAGTWWSNTDSEFSGNGDGSSKGNSLETDWYAGYAHTFDNGFGVNVMGNYYYYPNGENSFSTSGYNNGVYDGNKQDSFEASLALSYKWFTYTYFRVLTDYYGSAASGTKDGTRDTKGADYHELKANYKLPIGDINLTAKVGYQRTPNLTASQGDYAIGLNRDFTLPSASKPIEGFNAGAVFTDTFNVENELYYNTNTGRDANQKQLTFYVKRTW